MITHPSEIDFYLTISYMLLHRIFSLDFALIPYINDIMSYKFQSFALAHFKIIHEIR